MKAFWTYFKGCRYEWGDYVHANTAREARQIFYAHFWDEGEYIDTRAYRVPELDGKALTAKNIKPINDLWDGDWGSLLCSCDLCEEAQ